MRGFPADNADAFLAVASTWRLNRSDVPRRLGLAVSGGGDSMAMLWLVASWAEEQGRAIAVATVNHGLRPEAADEARLVADTCATLGLPHRTLQWEEGWTGRGNLQARARAARRRLLASWAREVGLGVILVGHTLDDQAETFLQRLARGSGVDGLAPMARDWHEDGVRWLRPLLDVTRADLRDHLRRHGRAWVDDPSNADERFQRVRARRTLDALRPLGLGPDRIGRTAQLMGWASDALRHFAAEAVPRVAWSVGGEVRFRFEPFMALPEETRLRLASAAVRWVSSSSYRPRLAALEVALDKARRKGGQSTVGGALIGGHRLHGRGPRPTDIVIGRETRAAARAPDAPTDAIWDGRWRLSGPHASDLRARLLGEDGVALCPQWRATGLVRDSVLASPAVWRGEALVAAPVAGLAEGWTAEVTTSFAEFVRDG